MICAVYKYTFIHSFIPNLGIKAEIGVQDFAPETLREILNSAKIKLLKTRFSFTRFVHLRADGAISTVTYLPETPLLKETELTSLPPSDRVASQVT